MIKTIFKLGILGSIFVFVGLSLAVASNVSAAMIVTFSDFTAANLGSIQLNNDTAAQNPNTDNVLRLTTNTGDQAGSAFLKNAISLADDRSFSTAFEFRISAPGVGE